MFKSIGLSLLAILVLFACGKKDPVNPPCGAVANAGPDKFIKLGEVTQIGVNQGDANAKYFWFPKDEVVSPNSAITQTQPKSTTNFMLKVQSGCGTTTDYVRVFVTK